MHEPAAVIERLVRATNDHDLDAIAACFAAEYVNETPAHPQRGFHGRSQVRANWANIFEFVPDVTARVLRSAVDHHSVWTEWEMHGTRADGNVHLMRGVIIFVVDDDVIASARFYLEPVDESAETATELVRGQAGAK